MKNKLPAVAVGLILLGGCAARGPVYDEQVVKQSADSQNARLITFRMKEDGLSRRGASVKLNGEPLGKLAHAGFNVFDVKPGKHALMVDQWDAPGTCTLQIDVAAGNTYYFEVKQRSENVTSRVFFGLIGGAIESAGRECGGAFSIEPVPSDVAAQKLPSLKLTK
jgi:hypothetical protein